MAAPPPRPPALAPTAVLHLDAALLAARKRPAVAYSPKRTFAVDDVVDHPTFGLGFVTAVRESKLEITFRGDVKTLIHARS